MGDDTERLERMLADETGTQVAMRRALEEAL